MAYEKKDGDISVFPQDKKQEKQPDFKGDAMIGGKMYDVAFWKRATRDGKTFLSGKIQPQKPKLKDDSYPF